MYTHNNGKTSQQFRYVKSVRNLFPHFQITMTWDCSTFIMRMLLLRVRGLYFRLLEILIWCHLSSINFTTRCYW